MDITLAYLAQSKLVVKNGDNSARLLESKFARSVRENLVKMQQKNDWKTQGRGAKFISGALLWGEVNSIDPNAMRIDFTGIARGLKKGEIIYAVDTDDLNGIFVTDTNTEEERRLFHSDRYHIQDLCAQPGQELIACSLAYPNGTANIATMKADGSTLSIVTEGDSVDQAPRWIPGHPGELTFQSAGVGRDRSGYAQCLGPFSIQKLDLARKELTPVLEDPRYDLLLPQITAQGNLYYLRRPYKIPNAVKPGQFLLDIVLAPFRLLYAIFQWLNFFTVAYTGKPLTAAGGPKRQGATMKQMVLWGNVIQAEKDIRRKLGKDEEAPALVPKSWQLMCRTPDGKDNVLASSVLAYDIGDDGSIVYANGSAIYHMDARGVRTRICVDKQIAQVVLL